jgi:hypothetical protein
MTLRKKTNKFFPIIKILVFCKTRMQTSSPARTTRAQSRRISAAQRIQTAVRVFLAGRRPLDNIDDCDPITLEPVGAIPKHRLFTITEDDHKTRGYDAFAWVRMLLKDRRHPATRQLLSAQAIKACFRTACRALRLEPQHPDNPDVKTAVQKLTIPARLVHIDRLAPFQRKLNLRFKRAKAAPRWLLIIKASPLYTITDVRVTFQQAAPVSIEYGIQEAANEHARFKPSSSCVLHRRHKHNGYMALGSDKYAAAEAGRIMHDIEHGFLDATDLNGDFDLFSDAGSDDDDSSYHDDSS